MPGSFTPRPDQIDLLTRGLDLPLDALREEHLEVISEVIALAWADLLRSDRATLVSGTEAEVNTKMVTRLCALIDENQMWSHLVRAVTRGTETLSFDGSRLEKRPDLSIHLTARNPSFPLVVECKLIDAGAHKGQGLYCDEGLSRFLSGEYAWAVRESFMLAYVRDGSTIASALAPLLSAAQSRAPPLYAVEELPVVVGAGSLDLARSRHGRSFQYSNRPRPGAPGPISVWHLWLTP